MAGLAANPVEALGDGTHCGGVGPRRARLVQSRSAWKWNMVSTSLGSVRSTTSDDSRSSLKTCRAYTSSSQLLLSSSTCATVTVSSSMIPSVNTSPF
uniref:Uncharacterized protein n=1 Tax=Oryza rufipogon TaxID=4529 RepID=A0A0E0NWD7_ORYRU